MNPKQCVQQVLHVKFISDVKTLPIVVTLAQLSDDQVKMGTYLANQHHRIG